MKTKSYRYCCLSLIRPLLCVLVFRCCYRYLNSNFFVCIVLNIHPTPLQRDFEEALVEAARHGHSGTVSILVEAGATTGRFQELENAVNCGLAAMAKELLSAGAKVRPQHLPAMRTYLAHLGDFELLTLLTDDRQVNVDVDEQSGQQSMASALSTALADVGTLPIDDQAATPTHTEEGSGSGVVRTKPQLDSNDIGNEDTVTNVHSPDQQPGCATVLRNIYKIDEEEVGLLFCCFAAFRACTCAGETCLAFSFLVSSRF